MHAYRDEVAAFSWEVSEVGASFCPAVRCCSGFVQSLRVYTPSGARNSMVRDMTARAYANEPPCCWLAVSPMIGASTCQKIGRLYKHLWALEQLGIQNEEDEEDEDDNDAGRDELLLLGTGREELARTVESFAATCVTTDRYVHLHHGAVKLETCTYRIATMLNLLTLTL